MGRKCTICVEEIEEDISHTTLVITSKELSSNGSLGLTFKSCTAYSVKT